MYVQPNIFLGKMENRFISRAQMKIKINQKKLLRNFSAFVVKATLNLLYPHSMNQKFYE